MNKLYIRVIQLLAVLGFLVKHAQQTNLGQIGQRAPRGFKFLSSRAQSRKLTQIQLGSRNFFSFSDYKNVIGQEAKEQDFGYISDSVDSIMQLLESGTVSNSDYQKIFSSQFQLKYDIVQYSDLLSQLKTVGPWVLYQAQFDSPTKFYGWIENQRTVLQQQLQFYLELTDTEPRLIKTFGITAEVPTCSPKHSTSVPTFLNATQQMEECGQSAVFVSKIDQGQCNSMYSFNEEVIMPISSLFRLYVLAALVEAVNEGTIAWTSNVPIQQKFHSLSGISSFLSNDAQISVLTLAQRMIVESDLSAADQLIQFLGREAVEAVLEQYGHSKPEQNQPFLTSREQFIIQYTLPRNRRAWYVAARSARRRSLLNGVLSYNQLPTSAAVVQGQKPIDVNKLGWFASSKDICRALAKIVQDSTAKEILGMNSGLAETQGIWSYLGYNEGVQPGVHVQSWIAEDGQGQQYVVVGAIYSSSSMIDYYSYYKVLAKVLHLIPQAS